MMLNVSLQKNEWFAAERGSSHIPVGIIVSIIISFELIIVVGGWKFKPNLNPDSLNLNFISEKTNTHSIGEGLYTDYIHLFQLSGMILLVAMIGAIVLTHRSRENVRKQNISDQINRRPQDTIEIKKVTTGSGA